MILLAGHLEECENYAHNTELGKRGHDWVHVCRVEQLEGRRGPYQSLGGEDRMVLCWHQNGYFGNDEKFYTMARLRGLLHPDQIVGSADRLVGDNLEEPDVNLDVELGEKPKIDLRNLETHVNEILGASVTGGTVTLPAGKYSIEYPIRLTPKG